MSQHDRKYLKRTPRAISAIFVLLAISLQLSLALYWTEVLQPKLRTESAADAKLLAESQSLQLISALQSYEELGNSDELERTISSLMLYQEPNLGEPFFKQIMLELDIEQFPQLPNIVRGQASCGTCFDVEVPLYSPDTFAIIGIAHFKVSDEFFRLLARDIRNQLVIQGAIALFLLLIAWGTSIYLFRSLNKEIERRKASEMALTENQRKYHRLVSSLNQYFVYTRDTNGSIKWISEGATQLYGHATTELKEISKLFTDSPINHVAKRYLSQVNPDLPQTEFEGEITDDKGDRRWILFSEVNLFDEQGKLISVEGLARDITKQKQIEADLIQAKENAEVASKAKGQFLANMSHEIRTPMNAIIGNTYLIKKTPLDGKQQQYVNRIDSSAHVLLGLVNDVLDISKIEAGKMELETIPFNIDELLTNLSNVLISQAQMKSLDILFDMAADIPQPIKGDPLRLGQVLLNLVNNAIKFTEQGEIVVSVSVKEQKGSRLNLFFSVKDDGIGIDDDKQDRLFKSFNQVDNSMTRRFGGTGLGLAICQHLVEMMHGSIGVKSQYGKGSTFYFDIWLETEASSAVVPYPHFESSLSPNVIIVDDSDVSATIASKLLQQFGVSAHIYHSAGQLFKALSKQDRQMDYDAIIIDHNMPGIDGLEAAEMLLKKGLVGNTKLLLMTTMGAEEKHQENIDQLFHSVLYKPLVAGETFDNLSQILRSSSKQDKQSEVSKTQSLPDFSDKQILLVEDNKINQEVAIALLDDINATTIIANNGQEAIYKLNEQSFDLVLMDIQMPIMDGLTAAKPIRTDLKIQTPILAMTAHALEEDREKSRQAGMNDYITKPIDVKEFYETLGRWLPSSELKAKTASEKVENGHSLPDIDGIEINILFKRIGNKASLLDEILYEFQQSCSSFPQTLNHAIDEQDWPKTGQILHRMKGEAGNIAANDIHQKTVALETNFKKNDSLDHNLLTLLLEDVSAMEKTLNHYFTQKSKPAKQQRAPETPRILSVERLNEIQKLTDKMAELLEKQSLDALELSEQINTALAGQVESDVLSDLDAAIHHLDYDLAVRYLNQIRSQLNLHDGAS
ncbi:PAS domain-containing hybrid sensor histidine kinase/response regulator [Planctobacterium marinum]|uniref:histidine kinase n=1 Tax=Planctobacterium marinum TaxID=1631968 RepID=A0AA48KP46_9ALTE|nr:hypothetical protein MACH26_17770 [Planctobacterium marinum]